MSDDKLEEFYIGQVFEGGYSPYAAAWCNENGKAFIQEIEPLDGKRRFKIMEIPAPTLEELRAQKLEELAASQRQAEENAHVLSTLGFEIDANDRANRDIAGLLVTTSDTDVVSFCDYNNVMHDVTRADLLTMQKEIIQNAQYIYQQKWAMRTAINAATTTEELEAVGIEYSYLDIYEDVNENGEA